MEIINMSEIEQFEEVCHVCGHVKIVHVDMSTDLGDPGFIEQGAGYAENLAF